MESQILQDRNRRSWWRAEAEGDEETLRGTLDRLSSEMVRTGAPSDAIELSVVNADGQIVPRPRTS